MPKLRINSMITPANAGLFLRVAVALPLVRIRLACFPLRELLERLDRTPQRNAVLVEKGMEHAHVYRRMLNAILVTALKIKRPCLLRSLTLFYLLRKEGLPVRIHFGVDKGLSISEGHSWLSYLGLPFMEGEDPLQRYLETYTWPEVSTRQIAG